MSQRQGPDAMLVPTPYTTLSQSVGSSVTEVAATSPSSDQPYRKGILDSERLVSRRSAVVLHRYISARAASESLKFSDQPRLPNGSKKLQQLQQLHLYEEAKLEESEYLPLARISKRVTVFNYVAQADLYCKQLLHCGSLPQTSFDSRALHSLSTVCVRPCCVPDASFFTSNLESRGRTSRCSAVPSPHCIRI
ncbi:hypothetical protein BT96DRAFT_1005675 [Gymnopus androsaceus JB14]|uniref:Uncharacterized protein n=1 Tax=Gymnopus androsaceus JB14 TaxID=1447944 RepID=A0A6A4GNR3_9AGAR|nr:hypothetical protein BT96DRAFT_1005675 [Gymnopus androsaceus JB14]